MTIFMKEGDYMKCCSKCKQNLEDTAFTRSPTTGKLASYCKKCQHDYDMARSRKYDNSYYQQNREKILAQHKMYDSRPDVVAKKKEYMKEYYSKPEVIARRKEYYEEYYKHNKEFIAQKKKEYREQNKDKINEYQRQWYANNREKHLNWVNRLDRRIGRSISKSIYNVIKGNKNDKHWEELVSFSLEELMNHLESQFTPEMSWDNYGVSSQKTPDDYYWEIDHIVPISIFNFDENTKTDDRNFQICWSLMNLRPLYWIDNRKRPKDGSDISEELKNKILNQSID